MSIICIVSLPYQIYDIQNESPNKQMMMSGVLGMMLLRKHAHAIYTGFQVKRERETISFEKKKINAKIFVQKIDIRSL